MFYFMPIVLVALIGCINPSKSSSRASELSSSLVESEENLILEKKSVSDCNSILFDSLNSKKYFLREVYSRPECTEYLIDRIDTNKKGLVFPLNPMKSVIWPYDNLNYLGIRYAAAVTALFSQEDAVDSIFTYRPMLFSVRNKKVIFDTLSWEDILTIRELYTEWWDDNKMLPIDTLRANFKQNSPLAGKYKWVGYPVR